ncbi:phosphatase PAP2 family protein [Demetria terragena]|uniref:phosphatase PAP2 family protein n=1 Tax=Demetria terragena TaxID=63959 RepID=UPI000371D692|nr:phosphatase PAP2 family protein [Demetria terragena]
MAGQVVDRVEDGMDVRWTRVRWVALGLFATVLLTVSLTAGVSIDRVGVTLWILTGLSLWSIGRGWSTWLRLLRDWGIFQGLLLLYDYGYGLAGRYRTGGALPSEGDPNVLGIPLHVTWPIKADEFLFGGVLPNQWLQEQLGAGVPWWAWIVTLTYCSHFFAAPVLAVVLWVRSRDRFHVWVRMMFAMAGAGITTYFLYPMAPPWLASDQGYIEGTAIVRQTGEGWTQLGFHLASQVLQDGQNRSNPVAAMPSLHMATAVLVAGFLMVGARRWVKALWILYPVLMAFTLVYTGEHYVIDVIMGTLLAVVILQVWLWLRRRRLAREALGEAEAVVAGAEDEALRAPDLVR